METNNIYDPVKDFEKILQNYKIKKLDVFEILIRKIGNPKALEQLENSIKKYNEAVVLNQEVKSYEAKTALASSEEYAYNALSFNYYEVNFKPGASQYLIMDEIEEMTESGLYLPQSGDTGKTYYEGIIIGIADCYIKDSGTGSEKLVKPIHKIGEKVRYRKGMDHQHDLIVNGKPKKCRNVDFTVVIGTIGTYYSKVGTIETSISKDDISMI